MKNYFGPMQICIGKFGQDAQKKAGKHLAKVAQFSQGWRFSLPGEKP